MNTPNSRSAICHSILNIEIAEIEAQFYLRLELMGMRLLSGRRPDVLLFDSPTAASEIAFMLGAQWDGCNGVVMSNSDKVAVNTVARLVGSSWCHQGDSTALLAGLTTDELLRLYAAGSRHFANANLRCAVLSFQNLSQSNLSNAKLNLANLNGINLSEADLTSADLSDACVSGANLSHADLRGAVLDEAILSGANLSEAKLTQGQLPS